MPHPDELTGLRVDNCPMTPVVVGASPFVYTAADAGVLVVQGGLVSIIEMGRRSVYIMTGIQAGVFPLEVGDQVRITHLGAPTVAFFKR